MNSSPVALSAIANAAAIGASPTTPPSCARGGADAPALYRFFSWILSFLVKASENWGGAHIKLINNQIW